MNRQLKREHTTNNSHDHQIKSPLHGISPLLTYPDDSQRNSLTRIKKVGATIRYFAAVITPFFFVQSYRQKGRRVVNRVILLKLLVWLVHTIMITGFENVRFRLTVARCSPTPTKVLVLAISNVEMT